MEGFAAAVNAIYDFMLIRWNIAGYNISFYEIFIFTILVSVVFFITRQLLDVDD